MVTTLGFAGMSRLIVLYAILHLAFLIEEGMDGTRAGNFSCVVFSYTFKGPSMNCTWKAGKKAPQDTQYSLYFQYYKTMHRLGREEKECPQYINNERGTHVGCYFPNVTVNQYKVRFRVNGSSKNSPIQPSPYDLQLYDHERLDPPHNITVHCPEQASYCTVQWRPPPSSRNVSHDCYKYQIKDEITNTIMNITNGSTSRNLPLGSKYILRFRTGGQICTITREFGEWSEQLEFGTDPNQFPTIYFLLVVLGTILIIVLLILICKRSHIWQKLMDPIPQPKGFIWQLEKNIEKAWVDAMPTADEKITVVEEMTMNCKNV